jgi:purine-binding chemotaxis protein CheW
MDQFLGSEVSLQPSVYGAALQFLTFSVGGEEYGVDIMAVNEIKGVTEITRLPSSPEFMKGVTNLRGLIIPIFDLRARFGLPAQDGEDKHVVIILSVLDKVIGISVDSVSDILDSHSSELKPPPAIERAERDAFVKGLISLENRMVIVLDVDHLFDKILIEKAVSAA